MGRWSMSYGEDLVVIWKPSLSALIFASEDMARCHLCTFLSALLPFSYSRHTLDHMREQAGGMGLGSLVFPGSLCRSLSYAIHAVCWAEGKTLHQGRNVPVPGTVLKWEMEKTSTLPVIRLVNLCLASATWVADNPMCRCCCMRTIHLNFHARCARCTCWIVDVEGKRRQKWRMLGFMLFFLKQNNL